MAEGKVIIVNPDMFGKDPDSKTTKANEVAKSFGLSDAALAEVEDFKAQLTKHTPGICRSWDTSTRMATVTPTCPVPPWCTTRTGRPPSIPGAA